MDNRILALWSTPRSASAVFESMMRRHGDFRCVSQPFALPYYRGADRRTTRFDQNAQDMSITYASTWADLKREHRKGRVFTIDHPNHIMHMADDAFLNQFQHTFLIHHPAQALPAMYHHWSTFTADECSYVAMRQLFDSVTEQHGAAPIVVDVDDLNADPYRASEAYCKGADIAFLPEALEASEGPPVDPVELPDIADVPFLSEMYKRCMPHYEAMAEHRI